ncbi:DNA-binding protein RHL1 [Gastrolobium bilobum]|uniref:DNA-binding protein RHL1 n=1 Tax=Gastrolobium bilobum TaxID=150636 RepID=UPI002AB1BCF4|nr:DNA-binding protein RHL1 [Gastrolobium bilobum]
MARGKMKKKEVEEEGEENPETIERKRLKALAFSNNMLSETPARSSIHLNPSSTVIKHHGKDIIKKSQRKSTRYLFSFPALIAPIAGGGKIGDLKDLGTKNPILYLDFPQGQMKLFGTIVYPKNRYLTLQFSRGGKNVMCEDYFDNMIVFSDAWWIGRKDENPEEARLELPKELYEGQQAEYDFKAGAGAASVLNEDVYKTRIQRAEQESPKTPIEDDLSDSEINSKDTKELVPVRHSVRAARKSYKFAEISSGESSPDLSEHEEKVVEVDTAVDDRNSSNILLVMNLYFVFLNSRLQKKTVVVDIANEDAAQGDQLPKKNKGCTSATASTEVVSSNRGSLVQATISTLFKKVEEKKAPKNSRKSPTSKASGQKLQAAGSKRKTDLAEGSRKRARKIKDKDPGDKIMAKSKECKVEDDDDIEEFSNASEDTKGSDDDWTA